MSEKKREILTFDKIVKYLVEKKIHSNCISCGSQDPQWTIQAEESDLQTGLAMTMTLVGDNINMGGMAMVPIVCQNCGFIKFYSAESIASWLEANNESEKQ
jgi:hypothetical protein